MERSPRGIRKVLGNVVGKIVTSEERYEKEVHDDAVVANPGNLLEMFLISLHIKKEEKCDQVESSCGESNEENEETKKLHCLHSHHSQTTHQQHQHGNQQRTFPP